MMLECYATTSRFYVLNNNLRPEDRYFINQLKCRVDRDGDYYWDSDETPLYPIINKLGEKYKLEIN